MSIKRTCHAQRLVGEPGLRPGVHPGEARAAASSHKIGFRQIHLADRGRVHYQKVCELDEKVLSASDIGRAYETPDDQLVEITDADLRALPLPTAKTIEVSGFLELASVDSLQLDTPYFLAPASPAPTSRTC